MNIPLVLESVRERGLIFTGPSIVAIGQGRKTQTRRLLKIPDWFREEYSRQNARELRAELVCPYGRIGDHLWARETWRPHERPSDNVDGILFKADDAFVPIANTTEAADAWVQVHDRRRYRQWRSPLFLPRWAARHILELTEIRVERLQDITEDDARREGLQWDHELDARDRFLTVWDEINGKRATWRSNPWVWVLSFRRLP